MNLRRHTKGIIVYPLVTHLMRISLNGEKNVMSMSCYPVFGIGINVSDVTWKDEIGDIDDSDVVEHILCEAGIDHVFSHQQAEENLYIMFCAGFPWQFIGDCSFDSQEELALYLYYALEPYIDMTKMDFLETVTDIEDTYWG